MKRTPFPGVVIGTAGHIDHGKTSLVRALTGVDTDRLEEEKRRGISIDLGFAHMTLPSGRYASFIDVPGHERFIKNMLAGVTGVQSVLLIVAANESVMPQTREHFEICRLLGLTAGVVALTKIDIASPDQIAAATNAVKILCADSFLSDAPIVQVSAMTGTGLDALRAALDGVPVSHASDAPESILRLPVDRSFSLKGFGTVVTGTLSGAPLTAASQLVCHPKGRSVRVRSLQVHGKPVPEALPGQRTAVNLVGLESHDIERGSVLTSSAAVQPSRTLAIKIESLDTEPIDENKQLVTVHLGAAECAATLKIIDPPWARLTLQDPLLAFPGDRLILRRPSPPSTLGGGIVVDAFPKWRMAKSKLVARLQTLHRSDLPRRIAFLVQESRVGRTPTELVRLTGKSETELQSAIQSDPSLVFHPPAGRVVSRLWLTEQRMRILDYLKRFHADNPAKSAAPLGSARLGLDPSLAEFVLAGMHDLKVTGDLIALASHRPTLTPCELDALARIETQFRTAGFTPPVPEDVLKSVGLDPQRSRTLFESLVKEHKLVRISQGFVFHADVIRHVRTSLEKQKGRRFSVPEFKEWTQISRKYAIPLLEYLDGQRITKRDGDLRVVL